MAIGTAGVWAVLVCGLWLSACGGNNYGYGREYTPSDAEEKYYENAADVSYEEVRRDPKAFEQRLIGWFGVVTGAKRASDGTVDVALDLRYHQQRHLCSDQFESSCKVTISERQGGPFSTKLLLKPEEASGSERFNVGSLVKVYGMPTGDFDDRGGPVIKAQFYRHWPHGAYVTTSGSATMRR